MLARLETRLPEGQYWRYEPKLDGFRGLLWRRASDHVRLLSGNARDLGPWFPELTRAAQSLPTNTLLDGAIVICGEAGLIDIVGLQERLSIRPRSVDEAAQRRPALLMVFDLLEYGGAELVGRPMRDGRQELVRMLDGCHPHLQVVDQTSDMQLASDWLGLPNLEGVVAKRTDRPYVSGRVRDWIEGKRQRTVDCVGVGVVGDLSAPKLVLALRHADAQLHHFAVSRPLTQELTIALAPVLAEAGREQPAIQSGWQHDAVPRWRPVPSRLVCEVRVSNLLCGPMGAGQRRSPLPGVPRRRSVLAWTRPPAPRARRGHGAGVPAQAQGLGLSTSSPSERLMSSARRAGLASALARSLLFGHLAPATTEEFDS